MQKSHNLSGIRVKLHDEIFHCDRPVLADVDANPTYCYLPAFRLTLGKLTTSCAMMRKRSSLHDEFFAERSRAAP